MRAGRRVTARKRCSRSRRARRTRHNPSTEPPPEYAGPRRLAAASFRPASRAGSRSLGGASSARRAKLIVTRHELEGSHEILDEEVLLEEEGSGAVQDRVVDEAEGQLHGEPHVGF